MNNSGGAGRGLDWLAAQVERERELFAHVYKPWVPPRTGPGGAHVYDVVIVGAGMYGMAAAFGLQQAQVDNILLIDRAEAGAEGPWLTFARMRTLRTPKQLTGIEFGIPSVSVRSWWEAQYGERAWQDLDRIPRTDWMRYLNWYRAVLGLPVQNGVSLEAIEDAGDMARLRVTRNGEPDTVLARHVVLATGLLGSGGPNLPENLVTGLDQSQWSHSCDDIDFAAFAGKEVGVLGAGASAFDNALSAVEAGASAAHLYSRRDDLPWLNAKRRLENAGFMRHFAGFPDDTRWRFMRRVIEAPIAPPTHTVKRATETPGFNLHMGEPWLECRADGDAVLVTTPKETRRFAHLIFGTGFAMDIARRPELAPYRDQILLWSDRFTPETGEESVVLARQPYLGPGLEFLEKTPGAAPVLGRVSLLSQAATLSIGPMFGGLNGIRFVLERVVSELCRKLIVEDLPDHYAAFEADLRSEKPAGTVGSDV